MHSIQTASLFGTIRRSGSMKIDLTQKAERRVEDIQALVSEEVSRFKDPALAVALGVFLVVPRQEMRQWDWSRENVQFPTWVIAESQRYDYGIVYTENGFGPEHPWGLVFSSHTNFGADYCWYASLESAFAESRLVEEYQEDSRGMD
jgi:hypothetical protein